ncbi:MAG: NADH:flavin oxidoreductase/NADH oxidase [Collinsella sp.]|nr:NADH:flavin oxidoreductase/NADH oxidase [Collinsella sp.]
MGRSLLFQPMTVRGLELPNRLIMPPMCQYSAATAGPKLGRPTTWHLVHYGSRAQSGVGTVVVEATGVVPEGRISIACLSLHDDAQIPAFKQLADVIHAAGARAFIQLNHAGRKGSSRPMWLESEGPATPEIGGWQPVAPSAIPVSETALTPRELTDSEVDALADAYAAAARRAMEAGFDGVQIHGAHGYLIHEFLSPASNARTDRWGGGFEGRIRFVREVVRRTRSAIGEVPLLIRLSATDWLEADSLPGERSWTLADTCRLAPELVSDGVDMINVSTGGNVLASIPAGPGYQVGAASAVRETLRGAGLDTPVSAVGLILTGTQAEQILKSGDADAIEVGRPLLKDPTLPRLWATELHDEATPLPPQYLRGGIRGVL